MLFLMICLTFADDTAEVPKNVLSYKRACEDYKLKAIERAEKSFAEDRDRMKRAQSEADKKKFLADLKKAREQLDAVKASPWHEHAPRIAIDEVGSIGNFYTPAENNMRIAVRFRVDKIEPDRVIGAIVHDGAIPKLLIRKGGAVARDIYSEPGETTYTVTTIEGSMPGWKVKKSEELRGSFEVISTDRLTLKPFDVQKWVPLLAENTKPKPVPAAPPTVETTPEEQAAQKLKVAKGLLGVNDIAAKKRLKEIVDKFPDTEAARVAAKLFAK